MVATRSSLLSRTWIAGVVGYSVIRALLAWPTFGQYGVNPLVFLILDIATAPPYAVGQVRIVQGVRSKEWTSVQFWAGVVLVTFLAPYVYIAIAGGSDLPTFAWVVLGVLVLVFGLASGLRIRAALKESPTEAVQAEVRED